MSYGLKNIYMKNLYNFVSTEELNDFRFFNLLIGRNGSGKTNIFRSICELALDPKICPDEKNKYYYEINKAICRKSPGNSTRMESPNYPEVALKFIYNFDAPEDSIIEFEGECHKNGDVFYLSKHCSYIKSDDSYSSFVNMVKETQADPLNSLVTSFCLQYVFQLKIFLIGDRLAEFFTKNEGENQTSSGNVIEFEKWSSGFRSVTNLIMCILLRRKPILCIDEPENRLEPRTLKRLMKCMFWICGYKNIDNFHQDTLKQDLTNLNNQWHDFFTNASKPSSLNKKSSDFPNRKMQLFVATHSPCIINQFLSFEDAQIYEFSHTKNIEKSDRDPSLAHLNLPDFAPVETIVSFVRKVNHAPWLILDNLGGQGSDLLQANGVIWVEGPSDVIYIKKWLEMYCIEENKPFFDYGIDYTFQMFGGTLLDSICLVDEERREENQKKLIEMFSFSRNAFIVIDSDAHNVDGIVTDKSKFAAAKKYISQQIQNLKSQENNNIDIWYNAENADIKTIEDYMPDEIKREYPMKNPKKKHAQLVTSKFGEKKLTDFKTGLKEEIEKLYQKILTWKNQC